jgi:hypothetical protein
MAQHPPYELVNFTAGERRALNKSIVDVRCPSCHALHLRWQHIGAMSFLCQDCGHFGHMDITIRRWKMRAGFKYVAKLSTAPAGSRGIFIREDS